MSNRVFVETHQKRRRVRWGVNHPRHLGNRHLVNKAPRHKLNIIYIKYLFFVRFFPNTKVWPQT